MEITASMVKELRERTGAGMMECKKALTENNGDIDAAAEALRKSGLAKADKKADRVAAEGRVAAAQAAGKAVLVEVNSETDFVARNDVFKDLARNLAMHVAMANPQYVRREDVPEDIVAAEREALRKQALEEGKPEAVAEKIVEGRLGKFFAETVLLEQPYIKDDKKTVGDLVKEVAATLGENIQVGRFARIAVGE